ncbi:MAG TPA: Uma2 family endonuclease [Chloroflexota bacterium]|jgi:Uma2 family endonuclease|nr:Uma2 family endonuclease [Chloroflexota bacterium]
MTTRTLITAEQFFATPDDNLRHDLVEGEVWTMSLAGGEHGDIAMRLGYRIFAHVEAHMLGTVAAAETGFILARNPDTVLGPDVAFVQSARIPAEGVPKKHWPLAPDLAVEIVSPGDRAGEIARKVELYLRAGVQLIWVIYPATHTVVVHEPSGAIRSLTDDDVLDGSRTLPGFSCPVNALWG